LKRFQLKIIVNSPPNCWKTVPLVLKLKVAFSLSKSQCARETKGGMIPRPAFGVGGDLVELFHHQPVGFAGHADPGIGQLSRARRQTSPGLMPAASSRTVGADSGPTARWVRVLRAHQKTGGREGMQPQEAGPLGPATILESIRHMVPLPERMEFLARRNHRSFVRSRRQRGVGRCGFDPDDGANA